MRLGSVIELNKNAVVSSTLKHVRKLMYGEGSGHDWWHVYRVWKTSIVIARRENGADLFVVQLAALLHDIADWKFNDGDEKAGGRGAREWLKKKKVDERTIDEVCYIIDNSPFKGAGTKDNLSTLEGRIVQDADRLDALGAIGIARTFAYGGSKSRQIYDPNEKPKYNKDFEAYKKSKPTTINHFHEKLFLLKERMNTRTGRRMALKRDKFMQIYLKKFLNEWDGKE